MKSYERALVAETLAHEAALKRQTREAFTAALIAHRWLGSLQCCCCQYGKNEPPLRTPRAWAEHVADVLGIAR